jgi:hypothetical protein
MDVLGHADNLIQRVRDSQELIAKLCYSCESIFVMIIEPFNFVMKNRTTYLFVTLLLFATASCKKIIPTVTPTLPPETHSGMKTLGCYVNNKLWLPQSMPLLSGSRIVSGRFYNNDLQITSYQFNQRLFLHLGYVADTGRYDLAATGNSASFTDSSQHDAISGFVDVKFIDLSNYVMSGTFAFEANGASVTRGRFDLRINQ